MSDTIIQYIFYGGVITPESLTTYKTLPNCLLAVGPDGIIDWIIEDVPPHEFQNTLALKGWIDLKGVHIETLKPGEFLLPGFIDTHAHAPQLPNVGLGQEFELLDWLEKITFPMEAKFSDVDFARETYNSVVRRVISSGTTTCCYYGSLHLEATKVLTEIIHDKGQRAFVGKCNMDRNSPDDCVERSAKTSVQETKELISYMRSLPSRASSGLPALVQPVITPRFAISCTPELLKSLGELASSDQSLRIQTHVSENKAEIRRNRELFPDAPNYTSVYDSFGLVRENTILAHGVYLEDAELDLIARRKAGISHCPTSNFNLGSGVAPIGSYLDRGIKVGLGTDFSGGFSPSILRTIQDASIASKVIALQAPEGSSFDGRLENRPFSIATLLYLATLGGAEVCGIDKIVGSFEPGKSFDALVVKTNGNAGNPSLWYPGDDVAETREGLSGLLERFLFCGDDRNISEVYVQGILIGGMLHHE